MKKYAIIGFGALGKIHFGGLMQIEKERNDICLTAICNDDIGSISKNVTINLGDVSIGNIDFSKYNLYTDYKEMIEKEELDFVFVTVPSFLHSEICAYCLKKGLDVYTEKPMAITMEQCDEIMQTVKDSNKKLMVGHCIRFSSEYMYLKELVESGKYGKPIKAEFSRKSPLPAWSAGGWLLDEKRSGSCVVDMHVHDLDAMMWLFGKPEEVTAYTTNSKVAKESVFALYKYPDLVVSIVTDWGLPAGYKFTWKYIVTFEKATVECVKGEVTLYTDEGETSVALDNTETMYQREEREFIKFVVDEKPSERADINSVYETMKLLFEEKERLC